MAVKPWIASAVLGGIVAAIVSKGGFTNVAAPGSPLVPETVSAAPAGGPYTPKSWASAFLGVIGEPRTRCNMHAIEAWEQAEGGAWSDGATANPLNTTLREPGSSSINPVGVQAFVSWQQGLEANAHVITDGDYDGILSALHAGDNAQEVADEVTSSPWGTGQFSATC